MQLATLAFAAVRRVPCYTTPLLPWACVWINAFLQPTPLPPRPRPRLSEEIMSTPEESVASRRESAARAAERRLMKHSGNADGKVSSTASPAALAGKRKAPGTARTEQVGFSDSDGSDSEVTFVEVSSAGCRTRERVKVGSSRGRGLDGTRKRGKKDNAAMQTGTSAATPGIGAQKGAQADEETARSRPPKTFRVVSWNIDCLNPENKYARVEEVCSIVLAEENALPDVILLQEVDAELASILNTRLGSGGRYRVYPPRVPAERGYFTLIYTHSGTVMVDDSGREDFPGSSMGRDLAHVHCTFNGKQLLVMTSHLESEKQSSGERKAQFKKALRKLLDFAGGPAIFAGDTNLREAEVKQEKLAKETGDMWQLCGADAERRFTWDTLKNDNLVFGGGFQPRARYDRMFLNPRAKACARSFDLLGTERMAPPHSCFPSDHFGIDAYFDV